MDSDPGVRTSKTTMPEAAIMMRAIVLAFACTSLVQASTAIAGKPFVIRIDRNMTCNAGEVGGSLRINDGPEVARTLELPWRDDKENVSHIQPGTYSGFIRQDGDKGWRIELENVPNHTKVQLHVGNYSRQTEGCVLIGKQLVSHGGTCALQGGTSRPALDDIRAAMAAASDSGVSSEKLKIKVVITGGGA